MAIIYTYPITELLATDDTVVITDASSPNKATRTATIGQIHALGPQGTVTDVNITGSQGFIINKDPDPFTSGVLNFAITLGEGLGLPADDPVDSVQFNKDGILTGIPEFTFKEATYSGGNLEVNLNVGGVNNRRGLVNVKGSGTAGQPGGVAFFNDNQDRGNVTIYGPTGNNTSGVISEINQTDLSFFGAILSVSPYYNKPSQQGIYSHFSEIAKISPLPIIVYNVPSRTGSSVKPSTFIRLCNDNENIYAIKESSGDLSLAKEIINKSSVVTANISPNKSPIISKRIKVKKPITTNPTAKEE